MQSQKGGFKLKNTGINSWFIIIITDILSVS